MSATEVELPPGTRLRAALRPSMFLLHVPPILAVVAAGLLGRWQLDAWQDSRQDRAAQVAQAPPVALQSVLGPDDRFPASGVGRPVSFRASWLPGSVVYVEGRPRGQDPSSASGYWTVALASTCGTDTLSCPQPSAMPVVLGWSPRPERQRPPPTGEVTVTGWLQPAESASESESRPGGDVLASLQVPDLLQRTSQDLYSGYVMLAAPSAVRSGLTAVSPSSLPRPSAFTALRNLLYAIQWWVFGAFAIYLWWRWTRDELAAQIASEP